MRSAEIDDLVDAFVQKVNSRHHERLPVKDVPQFLRRPSSGDDLDLWTDWQIHKADNSRAIEDLEGRIGRRFPASYRSLVARYCFPAFDCGPLFLFANTGEDTWDELSTRLFRDPNMSPALLSAGYLQIGRPHQYNYDPVCLAPQAALKEPAVVQHDHELILQFGQIKIVEQIAPTFIHLLSRLARGDEMPASVG